MNKFEEFLFRFNGTVTDISKDTRNNLDFIVSNIKIIDFDEWAREERKQKILNGSQDHKQKKSPDSIKFADEKKFGFIEFKFRAKSNVNTDEEVRKLEQKGTDGVEILNYVYKAYKNEFKLKKIPKPKLETYYVVYSSLKQKEFEENNIRLSAKKRLVNQTLKELSEDRNFSFISDIKYVEHFL